LQKLNRANRKRPPDGGLSENLTRLFLPFGLNNRRFALADRSLAFTYATSKAKGENHRADYDQEFSHWMPPLEIPKSL
jgi:hypothetical protein